MIADPIMQAFQLFQNGQHDAAGERCRLFLAGNPDHAEMNHLFGVIRFHQGRTAEALDLMKRAVSAPEVTAEMHNNYGAVLNKVGRSEEAIVAFNQALALKPNYADALNNLGVIYRDTKNTDAAIAALRRAVELSPDSPQAKANLRSTYRDVVPAWHFAMMDDRPRNSAYDAAIRRAVPGKRVLDIGTGSGLLAMMAARGGAASVTTCEAVGVIADHAREIIAHNGLARSIAVIGKPSTELAMGSDLPDRAQVLITETFASGLIGENVLPTLEHAHEHLLMPDATIIPAAGAVMGYLAGGETLKGMLFVDKIDGFDLTLFNDFAPPMLAAPMNGVAHQPLSSDIQLLRFDFKERSFPMASRRLAVTATASGACAGIVQWIRLELDRDTAYDNRPVPGAPFNGHWAHVLHRFPRLVHLNAGDVVPIVVRHDRSQVNIDLME